MPFRLWDFFTPTRQIHRQSPSHPARFLTYPLIYSDLFRHKTYSAISLTFMMQKGFSRYAPTGPDKTCALPYLHSSQSYTHLGEQLLPSSHPALLQMICEEWPIRYLLPATGQKPSTTSARMRRTPLLKASQMTAQTMAFPPYASNLTDASRRQ